MVYLFCEIYPTHISAYAYIFLACFLALSLSLDAAKDWSKDLGIAATTIELTQ